MGFLVPALGVASAPRHLLQGWALLTSPTPGAEASAGPQGPS